MTKRITAKPRLMRRKSSLRVSDGPVAIWVPLLLLVSVAAKKAAGMVSARTLPGLSAPCRTGKRVNAPDCEECVIQLRAVRVQLLFPYSGAASEERGTRDE